MSENNLMIDYESQLLETAEFCGLKVDEVNLRHHRQWIKGTSKSHVSVGGKIVVNGNELCVYPVSKKSDCLYESMLLMLDIVKRRGGN